MALVQIEDRGAVRHVVMTRSEKRNAMNGEMVLALGDAFRDASYDDSVRVLVVRGDGPMFSSGMDLSSLADLSNDPSSLRPFRREALLAWNLLEEMSKPTIVQIHGACIGGAMELSLTSVAARGCRRSSGSGSRRS
jgi:enoyl-CoA hydratase/carnithine racemase